MFENAFNNIDRFMRNDEGLASELDYAEQTSWLLFLKYLNDLEVERQDTAELENRDYRPILNDRYRWDAWAAPKTDGKLNHNAAMTGEDLIDFVNRDLFPYLKRFRETATSPDSLEYKIGEIFSEIINKFRSGYALRDVLEVVDLLNFNTQKAKHELSDLYESRIKRMGNAGRNGGEYYTPRPLIRAMIKVTDPKIGETIYDGAAGSAGFLCEAWEYMRRYDLSASDWATLQRRTFYGQEKKSLAYVLGVMNMILHGIDAPLQRPPDAGSQIGMPTHQLIEDRDGPQTGTRLQHRDDLGLEDLRQGIGPPSLARCPLLGGRARVLRDAIAGGRAEPGARRGDGDRGVRAMLHEEPHLVIGHVAAGHERSSDAEKAPVYPDRPRSPRRTRTSGRATPFLRSGFGGSLSSRLSLDSHPDRRASPIDAVEQDPILSISTEAA